MDWTGPNKKKLRKALMTVYSSPKSLARFVSDELDLNLNVISSESNLDDRAFDLIERCCEIGDAIDLLYQQLCKIHPDHPAIARLQAELQCTPLVEKPNHLAQLPQGDWIELFANFRPGDVPYVAIAFQRAFKAIHTDFWEVCPDHPPLNDLRLIRTLLEDKYGKPELAVQFAGFTILEFQQRFGDRDLTTLKQWRDRIAQAHGIVLENLDPSPPKDSQGYLLIALQESGRQTQKDGAFVTLFSELHVTDEKDPITFDASSMTCALKEAAEHLSRLIQSAENALIPYGCSQVILEIFLPCVHLEEDIAVWEVKNEQDRPRPLGKHRGFLIRSLDRAMKPSIQLSVKNNWSLLQNCDAKADRFSQFHYQECCPEVGDLRILLQNRPGLHFLGELPADREQRLDFLYDIINSGVPIALWSTHPNGCLPADLKTQFHQLFQNCSLTNFAELARAWQRKRIEPGNEVVKTVRLLCDCPDRWPKLPDPNDEEDLLIAS